MKFCSRFHHFSNQTWMKSRTGDVHNSLLTDKNFVKIHTSLMAVNEFISVLSTFGAWGSVVVKALRY